MPLHALLLECLCIGPREAPPRHAGCSAGAPSCAIQLADTPPSPSRPLPLAACSLSAVAFPAPPACWEAALEPLHAQQPPSPSPASMAGPAAAAAAAPAGDAARRRETAAACGQGLRAYRQRITPEQRRRERRRLAIEQADHMKTLEALQRQLGAAAPSSAAEAPQAAAADSPGAAAAPQRFSLAPVFQTATATGAQLAPLHCSRQPGGAGHPPVAAGTPGPALDTTAGRSSANEAMRAAASPLQQEPGAGVYGSAGAAAASIRPHPAASAAGGLALAEEACFFDLEAEAPAPAAAATPPQPPAAPHHRALQHSHSPQQQQGRSASGASSSDPHFASFIQGVGGGSGADAPPSASSAAAAAGSTAGTDASWAPASPCSAGAPPPLPGVDSQAALVPDSSADFSIPTARCSSGEGRGSQPLLAQFKRALQSRLQQRPAALQAAAPKQHARAPRWGRGLAAAAADVQPRGPGRRGTASSADENRPMLA